MKMLAFFSSISYENATRVVADCFHLSSKLTSKYYLQSESRRVEGNGNYWSYPAYSLPQFAYNRVSHKEPCASLTNISREKAFNRFKVFSLLSLLSLPIIVLTSPQLDLRPSVCAPVFQVEVSHTFCESAYLTRSLLAFRSPTNYS
jgi:hypothetical protein